MHYGPLLAGCLLLASQIVVAAEEETTAPTTEADATTSTSDDGQATPAPAPVSGKDYVTPDPDCD